MRKLNGMRRSIMAMMVIGTLCACTNNAPKNEPIETVGTLAVETPVTVAPKVELSEEEYDEYSKELIKDALSCDDKGAELILIELKMNGLSFPLSKAERVEEDSNDLSIVDKDSVEYYVMVNKLYDVDMIKDVKTDKIIYAVYE